MGGSQFQYHAQMGRHLRFGRMESVSRETWVLYLTGQPKCRGWTFVWAKV